MAEQKAMKQKTLAQIEREPQRARLLAAEITSKRGRLSVPVGTLPFLLKLPRLPVGSCSDDEDAVRPAISSPAPQLDARGRTEENS